MYQDPFEMYTRIGEPQLIERLKIWQAAIGLQGVDQLKTSDYLNETAALHMEGAITLYDVHSRIKGYYESQPQLKGTGEEEADKVSVQIAMLLSEDAFTFSLTEYLNIHKILFSEIYEHAGVIRSYNISKKEWILREKSVIYANAPSIEESLTYDINQEKMFNYHGLSIEEIIEHLADFVSNLWQVHAFEEGNTRTTAVFFVKYLRTKGFDIGNEIFAENAWYFRNALVRANYNNLQDGIEETTYYLKLFLETLLCDVNHELSNHTMHLDYNKYIGSEKANIGSEKVNIGSKKANIGSKKANIGSKKANIGSEKANIGSKKANIGNLSEINRRHVLSMYEKVGNDGIFGRNEVQDITGLGSTRASQLIKLLVEEGVFQPVQGHGKGKYIIKIRL